MNILQDTMRASLPFSFNPTSSLLPPAHSHNQKPVLPSVQGAGSASPLSRPVAAALRPCGRALGDRGGAGRPKGPGAKSANAAGGMPLGHPCRSTAMSGIIWPQIKQSFTNPLTFPFHSPSRSLPPIRLPTEDLSHQSSGA